MSTEHPPEFDEKEFGVDLWCAFRSWMWPVISMVSLALIANVDDLLNLSALQNAGSVLIAMCAIGFVAALARMIIIRNRKLAFGPNWVKGPTTELFENRVLNHQDIAAVESDDEGKKINIRSANLWSIVVVLSDYRPSDRKEIIKRIELLPSQSETN